MEEHREVLAGLRDIRQRLRKETPQYTDGFDDYVLTEVFRDWDVISEPVFTDAEILQLETSLQRARLRFTERTNALKVRLLEQLLDQYVDVIQKAETRHRQLLRDYERELREPPGSSVPRPPPIEDEIDPEPNQEPVPESSTPSSGPPERNTPSARQDSNKNRNKDGNEGTNTPKNGSNASKTNSNSASNTNRKNNRNA